MLRWGPHYFRVNQLITQRSARDKGLEIFNQVTKGRRHNVRPSFLGELIAPPGLYFAYQGPVVLP